MCVRRRPREQEARVYDTRESITWFVNRFIDWIRLASRLCGDVYSNLPRRLLFSSSSSSESWIDLCMASSPLDRSIRISVRLKRARLLDVSLLFYLTHIGCFKCTDVNCKCRTPLDLQGKLLLYRTPNVSPSFFF